MGPLFLAFTIIPFVELYLLIRIGKVLGAPSTLALVVITGLIGAWLAKRQGRKVLAEWRDALAQGRVPEEGVLGGILVLVGGLLLITPGVVTDFFGLFCLIPATRRLLAGLLQKQLAKQVALGRAQVHAYDFEWPPRPFVDAPHPPLDMNARSADASTNRRHATGEVPRGRAEPRPFRGDDVIDTEGEEV